MIGHGHAVAEEVERKIRTKNQAETGTTQGELRRRREDAAERAVVSAVSARIGTFRLDTGKLALACISALIS